MAKTKAVYAPGELSRVREKLGVTDQEEAKRMAQILGGEVGTERSEEQEQARGKKPIRRETVEVDSKTGKRSTRRVDVIGYDDDGGTSVKKRIDNYPGDDPGVPLKLGYRERVKMDQYAGQLFFEIKTSFQILTSFFSFFKEPIDYVSSRFVTKRLNDYYHKIEKLVTSARNLFPKSNSKRNNQLKRASLFVYKILDTMRTWNIEQIAHEISELQAHPRAVKSSDFADFLRLVYKPLFVLSDLNTEQVKSAFKLIYKILYLESPMEAKEKYQDVIRNIISALVEIRRDVQFGMYPILMKLISDRFIPYERFFIERRRRFMAFLNVTAADQLNSAELNVQQVENVDVEALQNEQGAEGEENPEEENPEAVAEEVEEEDPNDPKVIARKAKEEAEKAEQKAFEQGRAAIEALFPKAGWDKLGEFPDLYPYFAGVYNLRHGYELISPTDPLQQISILMHILDDLFIGLRYVNFGTVILSGNPAKISEEMSDMANNWRRYIEESFSREYLPRLNEFCRMLENSKESRGTPYAKKILNELYWVKRLYFLPYYKFESIAPPPFQKQDVVAIYSQIRKLRINLAAVFVGIEQGIRNGGASVKAPCDGINNPWEHWNFQVPNPVSKRLEALVPQDKRMNSTLIAFALSAVTLLDYIVNNENSWSYGDRPGPLFRSIRNEGITPIFGVDDKVDADQLFKESVKKAQQAQPKQAK
jgi:hypothetical protein